LKAYDYVIAKKKPSPYLNSAKLNRTALLFEQFSARDQNALGAEELAAEFEICLAELGLEPETYRLIRDYAHLLAFDLKQPDRAVELLGKGLAIKQLGNVEIGELKTEMADIYVLTGDVWEAVLLYAQVVEENKENELGDEVKMKKARLGYFMGEMSWAKAHLDVLKASTSKLIANDAMELSLFIGNNMNLDTTSVPLQLFARADLMFYRNQSDEALAILDSLQQQYPFHSLQDDIYYRKASIAKLLGQWDETASWLEKIVSEYPYDLLADDALLELGDLYRKQLNDPEKAMSWYLKLLEDHPGSVYVVEARNQYRRLRGDYTDEAEPSPEKSAP